MNEIITFLILMTYMWKYGKSSKWVCNKFISSIAHIYFSRFQQCLTKCL